MDVGSDVEEVEEAVGKRLANPVPEKEGDAVEAVVGIDVVSTTDGTPVVRGVGSSAKVGETVLWMDGKRVGKSVGSVGGRRVVRIVGAAVGKGVFNPLGAGRGIGLPAEVGSNDIGVRVLTEVVIALGTSVIVCVETCVGVGVGSWVGV